MLAPACLSVDNPRYLSFIPAAPTEAATLFDLVVGASSIYGGSWLEGAGAVYAENQALRWIADLAGLPAERRWVLRAGRDERQPLGTRGRAAHGDAPRAAASVPTRWVFVCSAEAHSSMQHAARVMDVDILARARSTSTAA